ncbi:MAG TPA: alpha/beta hydrolase [Casimicrobiaceae bacterium]|nr:alpha/beta hydrolase [Casimicrobiaceae bacterium]
MTINTHFVTTSELRIGYEVAGPSDGFPVVLAHGWPDDVRTWDRVLPALHRAGYRTFTPWLRGYGPTQFLRSDTFRSGQLAALGQDLVDFTVALGLGRHALVGHDWGARGAYIASALNDASVAACAALSVGYGTNHPAQRLSYRQTQNYWYHWLMATPRGDKLIREDRRAFTRHIWNEWFVAYKPDDAEFARTAMSFDNPDWADITLHSYRARWGHAPLDPRYAELEDRFDPVPTQRVPTLTLHGELDPVNSPQMSEGKEAHFAGPYERRLIAGAGHFPQRECVEETVRHIVAWLDRHR